ncbi:MAG: GNAT family N-acetyltransferase [bacterium]|nr:GNAT family N-acetyltransferase [bacterium]
MLRGKTLALRPAGLADLDLLTTWWNDPAMVEGTPGRWPTRPQELERRLAKKPDYDARGLFVIVLADSLDAGEEVPVGEISFIKVTQPPVSRCFDIGYSIHPDHRRRGFATQAGRLLIDQLFNSQPVHRIQAHCRVANGPSARALEGMGMSREGTLRSYVFLSGQYQDCYLYAILRSEWGDSGRYADRFDAP